MHNYSTDELLTCFDGHKIVLAGDSTVRQVFVAIAARFNINTYHKAAWSPHQDLDFQNGNISVEYIWDPWLNTTHLLDTVARISEVKSPKATKEAADANAAGHASLLVLGAPGLWAARYAGDDYIEVFQHNMEFMQSIIKTTFTPLSAAHGYGLKSSVPRVYWTPVQSLNHQHLNSERAETMTAGRIQDMNNYLRALNFRHVLWAQNVMPDDLSGVFQDDGLHVLPRVANHRADLLFNAVCNWYLPEKSTTGNACCTHQGHENPFLYSVLAFFTAFKLIFHAGKRLDQVFKSLSSILLDLTMRFIALGVVARLMDGTSVFHREPRQPDTRSITQLTIVWLIASLLSWEANPHSGSDTGTTKTTGKSIDAGFLSSTQADELKGLMQGIILIYHYYHGSQVLWIYKGVRVLVSAYFFLSTYGHTAYFLTKNDTSVRRVAVVLIRTHVLALLLMVATGNAYTTYYFVPVLTFWFIVNWAALRVWQEGNRTLARFCMKITLCTLIVNKIILAPSVLEALTTTFNAILPLHMDAQELQFRLGLERYALWFASIAAFVIHRRRPMNCASHVPAVTSVRVSVACVEVQIGDHLFLSMFAVAAMLTYGFVLCGTNDKDTYNRAHPYISWVPVSIIVGLRNIHPRLRQSHMRLPAKLGRISLETYLLQYHMLLGDNASSRLRIGFFDHPEYLWRLSTEAWLGVKFEAVTLIAGFFGWAVFANEITKSLMRIMLTYWPAKVVDNASPPSSAKQ